MAAGDVQRGSVTTSSSDFGESVLVGVDSGAPGRPYRPLLAGLIRLRIGSAATTSCMPPARSCSPHWVTMQRRGPPTRGLWHSPTIQLSNNCCEHGSARICSTDRPAKHGFPENFTPAVPAILDLGVNGVNELQLAS